MGMLQRDIIVDRANLDATIIDLRVAQFTGANASPQADIWHLGFIIRNVIRVMPYDHPLLNQLFNECIRGLETSQIIRSLEALLG